MNVNSFLQNFQSQQESLLMLHLILLNPLCYYNHNSHFNFLNGMLYNPQIVLHSQFI